ncbi:MAG: hypothetical protein ACUVWY_11770 [Desulfosoma sp.]|uniref:hypothetical protein n=1 Tax=Desulfosoma sp. TaxID=2603217 RepID=UPI00404B2D5B
MTSIALWKKLSELEPPLRDVLTAVLEEVERQKRQWEQSVTRSDFDQLREIIKTLAEAQAKTEKTLQRLEATVEKLAAVQERTEQGLKALAQAHQRLEQRFEELAEAQRRTEKRFEEMLAAQARMQQAIEQLAIGLGTVREQVGGLARSVAYALESEAYRHLPGFLKAKYGIDVLERLVRAEVGGREVNFFGRVRKEGHEAHLVGESVLRLDDRAKLTQLQETVDVVEEIVGGPVIPVLVTHFAKSEPLKKAQKRGIIVIQSFEW